MKKLILPAILWLNAAMATVIALHSHENVFYYWSSGLCFGAAFAVTIHADFSKS